MIKLNNFCLLFSSPFCPQNLLHSFGCPFCSNFSGQILSVVAYSAALCTRPTPREGSQRQEWVGCSGSFFFFRFFFLTLLVPIVLRATLLSAYLPLSRCWEFVHTLQFSHRIILLYVAREIVPAGRVCILWITAGVTLLLSTCKPVHCQQHFCLLIISLISMN